MTISFNFDETARNPCGRPLDPRGHHRAACQVAGVLERQRFPIESVARVCKAGGRVTTNVRVQDLDIPPGAAVDNRRLEAVVDGLPLFHGAQLAVDATMVSPVRRDGTAHRQCATTDGAAMAQARRRKEPTYPELAQVHGRARLVVVACEVGGQMVRGGPVISCTLCRRRIREVVERAWVRRWSSLLACAAARAIALSLLERRCTPGFDGSGPTSSEVYRDHRCEVWCAAKGRHVREFCLTALFTLLRAKKKRWSSEMPSWWPKLEVRSDKGLLSWGCRVATAMCPDGE